MKNVTHEIVSKKKKKRHFPFIKDHLTDFMHEILCTHMWNCNIQWSEQNVSGKEIKSCLLLPIWTGQSVEQELYGENLSQNILFFSLSDNLFVLELAIQAKVFALGCSDWGHHFYSASDNMLLL